jgi:hypothetical protein
MFFVIPAAAGIQRLLIFRPKFVWTPAFSGVTNRFTSVIPAATARSSFR